MTSNVCAAARPEGEVPYSDATPDDVSQDTVVEHIVARSVPVLFLSQHGLQLRKFHSVLPSGSASYAVQFCDLERWSSHQKLASVGLTPDYWSSTDTSGSSGSHCQPPANPKMVRYVEESPPAIDGQRVAKDTG